MGYENRVHKTATNRPRRAKDVDTVVLLSGDGDFDLLLEKIKKDHAVSTEVYGVPALTANSLIEAANVYHRIDENLLL